MPRSAGAKEGAKPKEEEVRARAVEVRAKEAEREEARRGEGNGNSRGNALIARKLDTWLEIAPEEEQT